MWKSVSIKSQNATDVVAPDPTTGKVTQDQESTYVYGSINHQITPKLLGTLIGSWQYSTFQEGAYANTFGLLLQPWFELLLYLHAALFG